MEKVGYKTVCFISQFYSEMQRGNSEVRLIVSVVKFLLISNFFFILFSVYAHIFYSKMFLPL